MKTATKKTLRNEAILKAEEYKTRGLTIQAIKTLRDQFPELGLKEAYDTIVLPTLWERFKRNHTK